VRNLVIRADAGADIGIGHVMRCFALAQAWKGRGGSVTIISRSGAPTLLRRFEDAGARVVPIQQSHPAEGDLIPTLAVLRETADPWLVLDGYHFDATYQRAIRQAGIRLLVIDDFAISTHYHADIVLNQNIDAAGLRYSAEPDTQFLLGPQYALLRSEFAQRQQVARDVSATARRILVTLGGADPDAVTARVVQALRRMEGADVEVRVVAGAANSSSDTLRALLTGVASFELVLDAVDMPSLMAWADVAVCAGGSTCWEMAFMGLPALLIVLADNQRRIAEGLDRIGVAANLGWHREVSNDRIVQSLESLLADARRRQHMSRCGQSLVDGQGASRVVGALREFVKH